MRRTLVFSILLVAALCPIHLSATPFTFYANLVDAFGNGAPPGSNAQAEVDLSADESAINVFLSVNLFGEGSFGVVQNGTGIYNGANLLYALQVPSGVTSGFLSGTFAFNGNDVDPLFAGQLNFDVLIQTFSSGGAQSTFHTLTFPVGSGLGDPLGPVSGSILTPEPASAGLLGLALAGLGAAGLRARRRHAKTKP
jgi:hypothetical protein